MLCLILAAALSHHIATKLALVLKTENSQRGETCENLRLLPPEKRGAPI